MFCGLFLVLLLLGEVAGKMIDGVLFLVLVFVAFVVVVVVGVVVDFVVVGV